MARVINEDADLPMLKSLDRVHSDFIHMFLRSCKERFVEVGVLLKSQTFLFVLETTEEQKNV
jgi:hypothetical protein